MEKWENLVSNGTKKKLRAYVNKVKRYLNDYIIADLYCIGFRKTNSINLVNVNSTCNERTVITERWKNVDKTAFKKS